MLACVVGGLNGHSGHICVAFPQVDAMPSPGIHVPHQESEVAATPAPCLALKLLGGNCPLCILHDKDMGNDKDVMIGQILRQRNKLVQCYNLHKGAPLNCFPKGGIALARTLPPCTGGVQPLCAPLSLDTKGLLTRPGAWAQGLGRG